MNTDALQWPEPAPSLARAVAAEFRLLSEIGRGGMGVVYLAEDTRLLRRVAIKTLLPHLASDALVRERFVRESRTAAGLSHPGIVPIYAAADQAGVVYFVMGYVQGESLADRLLRTGPLKEREALLLVRQVAEALGFAHDAGVVHRDIKAENVLVDAMGRAVITDFGIARMGEAQPLTATGTVLGSVYYMSPEQVTAEILDGRSDIYSLGVLLYHLLTGRYPYERPQASAVLVAHVTSPVPGLREHLPDVNPALDALVRQMLAKAVVDRVPSAQALLQRIDDLLQGRTSPESDVPAQPAALMAMTSGNSVSPRPAPVPAHSQQSHTKSQTAPATLSSDEAREIWERAAELQAHTGVMVPPPAFALQTPPVGEPLTRGYNAVVVKDAAIEAGIDARYVDRALAERAAAQAQALAEREPVEVRLGEQQREKPSFWIGAHRKLEFEAVVDGEVPLDFFEEAADEARRALGELVVVNVVGRTLTITTSGPRARGDSTPRIVQVQVAVRNGRTTIRVFEDLSQISSGVFGGLGIGAGLGMGMAMLGIIQNATHSPPLGLLALLTTFVTSNGAARVWFGRTSRKREKALRELVARLARLARVEMDRKKLRP